MPANSGHQITASDVLRYVTTSVRSFVGRASIARALDTARTLVFPAPLAPRMALAGGVSPHYWPMSVPPLDTQPESSHEMYMQRRELRRPLRTGEFLDSSLGFGAVPRPHTTSSSAQAENDGDAIQDSMEPFRMQASSASESTLLSLLAAQTAPSGERVTRLVRGSTPDTNSLLIESVQTAIAESTSIPQLFNAVAIALSSAFDLGCALAVSARDHEPILAVHHPVKEFASATGSWLVDLMTNEEIRHCLKTEINPLSNDQPRSDLSAITSGLLTNAPVRAIQLFPLATKGRWVGGVLLFDDTLLKLDPETHGAIKHVAHAIGLAVGEMLHSADTRTNSEQWRGWARVMTAMLAGEPVATLLRDVLAIGCEIVQADGALVLIDQNDLPTRDRCVVMGTPEFERLVRVLAQYESATEALFEMPPDRDPVLNGTRHAALEPLVRTFHAPLVVPIQHGEKRLGGLALFRSANPRFTPAEQADARQFASVMAATLRQRSMIERQQRQERVLTTVRNLADRLNRASTQQAMAEIAVEVAADAFGSGKATLHVYQEQSERLVMAAANGLPLPFVTANAHPAVGAGPFGMAAQRRNVVVIEDVKADADWTSVWHIDDANLTFRSVWSIPLLTGDDRLLGTLTVYHVDPGGADRDDIAFLQVIGNQIASALDRARLADRSQDLYRATVESLAAAVDAKDPFTHNHSWQVATYSRQIAEALHLSASETEVIELAGLLHDVGKIGIPDRVLQKPDALAPDEWAMMQRHPDLGARILGDNPALAAVVPLVRHHHERYDGRGYPDQLVGNDIPLGAAIVGLADAFDTMTSDRPYRRARSLGQAIDEVRRSSGTHFHPQVVEAFLKITGTGEIGPLSRVASRSTTRELRLKRVVGAEARGFGLLQRITTEIGALVDLDRFLHRLNELMNAEFPDSVCEIYAQDPASGDLVGIANRKRQQAMNIPRGQGIPGWVAAHGMSQNVPDVLEDPRYMTTRHRLMRSVLAVPLVVDGHCAGVLSLEHPEPMAYSPSDQHVLEIVATYVAQAIQVAHLHDRLKRNSNRDPLTGLLNHREFYQQLEEEVSRARMTAGKLAIAIIDVQELRSINRTHGHAAGDDILKGIADVLRLKVRSGDTVARYGGDEFALLVPRIPSQLIRSRVESISEALAELQRPYPVPGITFGVASFPADGTSAAEIIANAEQALRAAARSRGRSAYA